MFAESMCFMLFCVRCSALFGPWNTLWANLWCLWADWGVQREAHGVTLGAFELQFSSPWGNLGVILVAIGSMLGSLGCSKWSKMLRKL